MRLLSAFVFAGLWAVSALAADVPDTTRTSAYDWQCERADGSLISGHQRQDKAIVACQNAAIAAPGQVFTIRGGTYRVTVDAVVVQPETVPAVLSWEAPTMNVNGTPLTDGAGYRIYVREEGGTYGTPIDVPSWSTLTLTLEFPPDGKLRHFAMTAYNSAGVESAKTGEVSKVMR